MKRAGFALLLAAGVVIISTARTIPAETHTQISSYSASFRTVDEQELSPGGSASSGLPVKNEWGFNSWLFMEVEIPVFSREAVQLDEPMDGKKIPVLTFEPNDGWVLVEEDWSSDIWRSVWFYSAPVPTGSSFTPLFGAWDMTNFRVRNGMCGTTSYKEICEKAEQAVVRRHSLQADGISGDPETLWSMVK